MDNQTSFWIKIKNTILSFFKKIAELCRRFVQCTKSWLSRLFGNKSADSEPHEPNPSDATVVFGGAETLKHKSTGDLPQIPPAQLHSADRGLLSLFKPRDSRPPFALSVVITTCKIALIAIVAIIAIGVGSVLGVANAYLGTTPELDLDELQDLALTSYIYDSEGTLLTSYASVENRDYASLDEIPKLLQEAVIAVEDVRFYHHNGVDLKRLVGAFVSNMSNNSTSGGSTITQQLIKNQLLSSERSYKRKIQEASLALQLEQKYSKEQILEAYLNTIPLGASNYGVKAAAKDYFGKELDELTLKEIACLAGITQYPYAYNPRRAYYVTGNTQPLEDRIADVLNKMYQAGYISLEERDAAMAEKLNVLETSKLTELYDMPHFIEYAIEDVIGGFIKQRGLEDNAQNRAAIENELRTKGYNIYLTVDADIQNQTQTTISEYDGYPSTTSKSDRVTTEDLGNGETLEFEQPQAAAVVLEHSTGEIKAIVGSRNKPTLRKTWNRATQSRLSVGSSIKPLAVYGPAFEKGLGLGTIIENIRVPISGWDTRAGYPLTGTKESNQGPVTIRSGITGSINIVAARVLMEHVGLDAAYDTLLALGIGDEKLNKDGVGLALGSSGITAIEMAGAYGTIANGGIYIQPLSYARVTDRTGKTLLDAENIRETRRVFSPATAYMLTEALENAVKSGTGWRANIKGITTAGKTGTNSGNKGIYFAGFTHYYTSSLWVGHDNNKELKSTSASKVTAPLWGKYMTLIHEDLEDAPILEGSASDWGVTKATVCSVSGMKATEACAHDAGGHTPVTDYFPIGSAPTQPCTWHMHNGVCTVSGQLAGEYCPQETVAEGGVIVLPGDSAYLKLKTETLLKIFPNLMLENVTCTVHTFEWAQNQAAIEEAIAQVNSAISNAKQFMTENESLLTAAQISTLNDLIAQLTRLTQAAEPDVNAILNGAHTLTSTVNAMRQTLPDIPTPSPDPSPSDTDPETSG